MTTITIQQYKTRYSLVGSRELKICYLFLNDSVSSILVVTCKCNCKLSCTTYNSTYNSIPLTIQLTKKFCNMEQRLKSKTEVSMVSIDIKLNCSWIIPLAEYQATQLPSKLCNSVELYKFQLTKFADKDIKHISMVPDQGALSIITFVLIPLPSPYTISSFDYKTNKRIKIRKNYIVFSSSCTTMLCSSTFYSSKLCNSVELYKFQRTNNSIELYNFQLIKLIELIKYISINKFKRQEGTEKLMEEITKTHKNYLIDIKLKELSPAQICLSKKGWIERCLHWMAEKYCATLRIIRNGFVQLRGEEMSNSINTIYVCIFFIFGIGFFIYFPSLFEFLSGIDLYNSTDLENSKYFVEIRKIFANGFWYFCFYFFIFLHYRFKLSIPFMDKSILTSTIVIKGGFEGLGDTSMDVQQPKESRSFLEIINSKDPLNSLMKNNPEVKDLLVHYPAESSNANQAKPNTECCSRSGYPHWPITTPAFNLSNLPESNSETDIMKEDNNKNKKKQVRLDAFTGVKEITKSGLEQCSPELIDGEPKYKLKGIKNNYKYPLDWESVVDWKKKYPEVNEGDGIEIVYPKLEAEELKYKSSLSKPVTKIENSDWQINNPSTSLNLVKYIKNIHKKWK